MTKKLCKTPNFASAVGLSTFSTLFYFPNCFKLINSIPEYGFRSSQLTVDLLKVKSDRIAREFDDKSGATQAVELDISKAF